MSNGILSCESYYEPGIENTICKKDIENLACRCGVLPKGSKRQILNRIATAVNSGVIDMDVINNSFCDPQTMTMGDLLQQIFESGNEEAINLIEILDEPPNKNTLVQIYNEMLIRDDTQLDSPASYSTENNRSPTSSPTTIHMDQDIHGTPSPSHSRPNSPVNIISKKRQQQDAEYKKWADEWNKQQTEKWKKWKKQDNEKENTKKLTRKIKLQAAEAARKAARKAAQKAEEAAQKAEEAAQKAQEAAQKEAAQKAIDAAEETARKAAQEAIDAAEEAALQAALQAEAEEAALQAALQAEAEEAAQEAIDAAEEAALQAALQAEAEEAAKEEAVQKSSSSSSSSYGSSYGSSSEEEAEEAAKEEAVQKSSSSSGSSSGSSYGSSSEEEAKEAAKEEEEVAQEAVKRALFFVKDLLNSFKNDSEKFISFFTGKRNQDIDKLMLTYGSVRLDPNDPIYGNTVLYVDSLVVYLKNIYAYINTNVDFVQGHIDIDGILTQIPYTKFKGGEFVDIDDLDVLGREFVEIAGKIIHETKRNDFASVADNLFSKVGTGEPVYVKPAPTELDDIQSETFFDRLFNVDSSIVNDNEMDELIQIQRLVGLL
jgi:hypothetical protein